MDGYSLHLLTVIADILFSLCCWAVYCSLAGTVFPFLSHCWYNMAPEAPSTPFFSSVNWIILWLSVCCGFWTCLLRHRTLVHVRTDLFPFFLGTPCAAFHNVFHSHPLSASKQVSGLLHHIGRKHIDKDQANNEWASKPSDLIYECSHGL